MMRRGGSSSRGGHCGGGSDEERKRNGRKRPAHASDPERARRVASDAGRKRGARNYTNYGIAAPPAYTRRAVDEYDRQMEMVVTARGSRYEPGGSSSGTGSSAIARALLPPPKRAEEEQQGLAPRAGRVGLLPGDYVDDGDLDWVTAELMERTKDEQQQLVARRQMEEELNEFRYRHAIEESLADMPWGASDFD